MELYSIKEESGQVVIRTQEGNFGFYGIREDIIRAVYTKSEEIKNKSLLVEPEVYECKAMLEAEETEEKVIISAGKLKVLWDKDTGACTWEDALPGKIYFREAGKSLTETEVVRYTTGGEKPVVKRVKTVDGERSFIENLKELKDRMAYRGKLEFDWEDGEAIYGLGQGEEGIYNYRHHQQYLYQHNMRIPMPFFVSSNGYGVFLDCASLMTFNDDENGSYIFMDTVDQMDYYVIAGDGMDDIIGGYRMITGTASMLPKWAYGYVQSKEAYHTASELLEIGEEYRKRNVPVDCIVQDWNTWVPGLWGEKIVDESRYGNIKEVNDRLHDMNIHTMVSVWPNMAEGGKNHQEFVEAGQILGDYSTYDAFDEKARERYWKQASEGLFSKGFDSWWCDSTEPFSGPDWGGAVKREPWERYLLVGNEHKKYLDAAQVNAFAMMHAKGIFENQRKEKEDKRVLNLTRSGYASSQKYGVILWSGDISATWDVLKKQIHEGLNMAMSGMPYWTLDIGGFFVVGSAWQKRGCNCSDNPDPLWFWKGGYNDGVDDKGYCELYTRWFEFGTFLPIHRSHGTDTPREIWNFGEPGTMFYDAINKFIRLRYRLMPYIYSMAGSVTRNNDTIMRSLMFDFAGDERVKDIGEEYMFGREILVCPVTEPMYYEADSRELDRVRAWECYLPDGAMWYDFWSDTSFEGGQYITAGAPIDKIPLFVRAGSILPQNQEEIQYASQKTDAPMLLQIYPGADGSFTLYEDAGDDYGYENGEFTEIPLIWDNSKRTLTIGRRTGSYPGMQETRCFTIAIGRFTKEAEYSGDEIVIQM